MEAPPPRADDKRLWEITESIPPIASVLSVLIGVQIRLIVLNELLIRKPAFCLDFSSSSQGAVGAGYPLHDQRNRPTIDDEVVIFFKPVVTSAGNPT